MDEERAVGVDVGLTHFATLVSKRENHRQEIENPRFLKKLLPSLRYLSKQLSKKQKESQKSLKAKIKLSKLHARIKNLRNDFAHQLSSKLIKTHNIFCIESLDIASLLQENTKAVSRAIADVGWSQFLHTLKYKAEESGKHIVEADKYSPSSQIYASCGHRQKMPLFVRQHDCQGCGHKSDRDFNSAIVLKAAGISVLKARGAALMRGS